MSALAGLWDRCAARAGRGGFGGLEPAQSALLHIVGLLVCAPRNDVFLEQVRAREEGQAQAMRSRTSLHRQALRRLITDHVTALLAALNRLFLASLVEAPDASGESVAAARVPPPPRTGQVVDWMRMLLDAHFARLAILVRSAGGSEVRRHGRWLRHRLECAWSILPFSRTCTTPLLPPPPPASCSCMLSSETSSPQCQPRSSSARLPLRCVAD